MLRSWIVECRIFISKTSSDRMFNTYGLSESVAECEWHIMEYLPHVHEVPGKRACERKKLIPVRVLHCIGLRLRPFEIPFFAPKYELALPTLVEAGSLLQ
mmetsp:Transcript_124435/g.194954  ORF Transcript_124435/g.194954 Transcript_124435/m.194954 type:complete len:100 (-) Transcript_124435:358-657(-)